LIPFGDLEKGGRQLPIAMRIDIENTIPSYLVARPTRDRLQAACQQITKDWWERKRGRHALFASQIVLGAHHSCEFCTLKECV